MKFINIEGYRENCDIFNPISIDSPEEKNYCPQTYFAVNNIFSELITESEKLQARTNLDISWKNLLGEVESAPGLKDFILDQLTWDNINGDATITESLVGDELIIVNQDGENKAVKASTLIKGAKEIIEISIGEDNTFPKIKVKDYINKIPVVTQSNKGIYITKTHTFIEDDSEGLLCKDIFVLEYSDLLTTTYVKITYRPDDIDEDILIELKQDNLYIYPFNPQGSGTKFLADDGSYKEVPSSDYDDTEIKAQIKTNADVIAANKVDMDSKLSQLGSITEKLEAKDNSLQSQIDSIVKEESIISQGNVEVVTGENLKYLIGEVSAGDSVTFTMSSDSVKCLTIAVTINGGPDRERVFWDTVNPAGTYFVTHVMETSGKLYLWTNAANISAGGTLSYSLISHGLLILLEKSLNENIKKASYDFAGNVLVPFGSDDYSISFSNKEGEGDNTVCTVEFTHPIILHAISKDYIPVATRTFEKAPWNYGCIVALFEKTGNRKFLRMEVTPMGISPANQFAFNQNEIAVPVIAWEKGQVTYSYQDDRLMKKRISAIENKIADLPSKVYITPPAIYSVCNDINWKRNYSLKLYIDHLLAGLNSKPNVKFSNGATSKVFYSKYNSYQSYINSTSPNTTLDVNEVTISDTLSNAETISITHRSVRNKATADKVIRLLCIGDSVTEGVGAEKGMPYSNSPKQYWSWVKALFEMDNIEAGSGYNFETLGNLRGTSNGGYTFDITDMNGLNKTGVKAFACGVGGSKTSNWLSATLNNGATNPFFDIDNNKFSLKYWVENYRTLIVNEDGTTERCNSENKGSLAPSDTTQNNVCEPTHVLIQLGYNQSYGAEGTTRDNYIADMQTMINTIHEEYPNVYILLSLPDTAGTYYPENFAAYIGEGDDIYSLDFNKGTAKGYHNSFAYMNKDLIALSDEDNKIYYCPTYFASPLVYGATVRDISEVAHLASKNDGNKAFVHEGSLPQLHPSCVAHANWAYQIYGLLKYTALKLDYLL